MIGMEVINISIFLVGKPKMNATFLKHTLGPTLHNNIKTEFIEIGLEELDQAQLGQNSVQQWALLHILVPYMELPCQHWHCADTTLKELHPSGISLHRRGVASKIRETNREKETRP
jgi:hypothetical protein